MKSLAKLTFLKPLAFLLILTISNPIASFSKDENSVIIATVDNVKGLIDLNSVQSICNDFIYDQFKFIGIPGELSMYNKDCVCDKYQKFKQLPMQSSELFMKIIRDCKLNITLQSLENATQTTVIKETGGYTIPVETEGETEEEIDKIEEEIDIDHILIYPNPVSTSITITFVNSQSYSNIELKIFDALGKEVMLEIPQLPTEEGVYEFTIDLSMLQKGLYFFNFIQDEEVRSGRIYKS